MNSISQVSQGETTLFNRNNLSTTTTTTMGLCASVAVIVLSALAISGHLSATAYGASLIGAGVVYSLIQKNVKGLIITMIVFGALYGGVGGGLIGGRLSVITVGKVFAGLEGVGLVIIALTFCCNMRQGDAELASD